ncbi:MAG: 3-deoxy-manno-octulosonate cytidylyltransferase (CMP-KDO synthetase) [Pseudohongiellaceae bacterium]|jgi:3-deoxy-manno-octulosonate cytidylyltransferase (CMP-KDO synthetase)
MTAPRAAAILPARYASTRLPGKMLLDRTGKTLIQHVWEQVSLAQCLDPIIIATDDERIAEVARGFGAQVAMTRADHASGTDRVAEVAAGLDCELVMNIQGDEPEIDPGDLDRMVQRLAATSDDMTTLARPFLADEAELLADPNAVKVVFADDGQALYFSRSPIPYGTDPQGTWLHLGVYAYRRAALFSLAEAAPHPLELRERLEQLRALALGLTIGVVPTEHPGLGIDTPEDYARFVKRFRDNTPAS